MGAYVVQPRTRVWGAPSRVLGRSREWRAAARTLIAIVLLPPAACIGESAPEYPVAKGAGFEFRPGVLVDVERAVAYSMNPHDGIDATELESGSVLWTTVIAEKPLLLLGETLVAQAGSPDRGNVLRIVLLDARDGTRKSQTEIELPPGVEASIDEGLGTAFRVDARMTQDGLVVAWTSTERSVSPMPDLRSQTSERTREGAVLVDLTTGKATPATDRETAMPPASRLPANLSRLRDSGSLSGPLWRCGDTYAAAFRTEQEGVERTVLRRWWRESGASLPEVALFSGPYTIRYPSADGCHLLASRLERTAAAPRESYEWLIFSLATGERIAELHLALPAAWFFIAGPNLVHEVQAESRLVNGTWVLEPKRIRAIDLRTGVERWVRPVRDPAYRGPVPSHTPAGTAPPGRPQEATDLLDS